jgi:hypothetical protein
VEHLVRRAVSWPFHDTCPREVSEWAGHNSVAFTLTRYGGLFEDGSGAAVDRLDTLLGGGSKDSDNVLQMDTRKLR